MADTATKERNVGTTIRPCTCKSKYQDEKYGVRQRVHNGTAKGHRCTVCSADKS